MRTEIEFLPANLEIQENPPSPLGRSVAWTIMLFITIAVIWSFTGHIDIVASAQGKIIPGGRVKIVQPFEIGVVRQIHVHEGQTVDAGDPLIELDATATRADLGQIEESLLAARLDHARYRQLSQGIDANRDFSEEAKPPTLEMESETKETAGKNAYQLQQQMLDSQWRKHHAKLSALDSAIRSRKADLAATKEQIKKFEGILPLITRRADALRQMVNKKLGPQQSWLELEEQRLAQQQDLAALRIQAMRIVSSIEEAAKQREALDFEFRQDIFTQLMDTGRRIEQLKQQKLKAQQRAALQILTSPVSGVVQQLAVHTLGGVVTPAQELMRVVPRDQALEVEAWVLNKDIGFVDAGQTAEIKIETFPFTRYGIIEGEILDVSDDAVNHEKFGLTYVARVRMTRSTIKVGKKTVKLGPGMAVTVEVKTGKRRLIEFLLSPLLRYRDESFGER